MQRYEATRYAGVSIERIQAVADALGLTIRERVTFPTAAASPVGGTGADGADGA